jgi:hypothetical protein
MKTTSNIVMLPIVYTLGMIHLLRTHTVGGQQKRS